MVVVLAGRRPDPEDSPYRRFPVENAIAVRERMRSVMVHLQPRVYVSSGACGADLLGQDVARTLDIDSYVVLPYEADRFRRTSVVDRPGHWGELYDRIIRDAQKDDRLVNIETESESPFLETSREMLDISKELARSEGSVNGVVVWEGGSKPEGDITKSLKESIIKDGGSVREVSTSF